MLEKIGLPSKPSLRGNNWVIDATHCQGCSSHFTFINRKHHCRRCGGLFCGNCTSQRMYLRGQGESPVRICEPCKTLEEAARFETRYGHKNKSRKGDSKSASNNEDDVISKVLGDSRNESFSSDKDSLPSMQRATSASSSNIEMEIDLESTTPDELRQRAVEEKKKYKVLKAEGKPEEALRAFKRGKELERQAGTLEIELRKNRRKALSSTSVNESTKVGDGKQPKQKDDLVSELRELGWSDHDIHDADKKPVNTTLEGELSTLLKEVSQKTNKPENSNISIDRSEVVAIKKRALALKREGKLTEAKEELKRAKILEKQIEEKELLGDDEDSDDEFTSLIRSMDIDKKDVLASGNEQNHSFDFNLDHLLRMDDIPNLDGNFDVTDDDIIDPEMSAALQSLGWTEDNHGVDKETLLSEIQSLKREALNKKRAGNTAEALVLLKKAKLLEADIGGTRETLEKDEEIVSDYKMAPKSKLAIQRELLALKKKALALRREGKVDEADQELMKGKALEQQLDELENGPKFKVKPADMKPVDFSVPMDIEDEEEDVTDTDMNDPSYLSLLQNLGWQDEDVKKVEAPKKPIVISKKSKAEIQRELLVLKRKSLALRREGNIDEAEEVLKTTKGLEAQLAEMEAPNQDKDHIKAEVLNQPIVVSKKSKTEIQRELLTLKRKSLALRREGNIDEAEEVLKTTKGLEAQLAEMEAPKLDEDDNKAEVFEQPVVVSKKSKAEIQRELLTLKRKSLALRREGNVDEAEEVLKTTKGLEAQLAEMEAPKLDEDDNKAEVFEQPVVVSKKSKAEIQRELLTLKRKSLALRREGNVDEAEEVLKTTKGLEAQLAEMEAPKLDEDDNKAEVFEQPVVVSKKSKAEIQRELLTLKRKSLALRREGNVDEAEEVLKTTKGLEAQLAEMEAPKLDEDDNKAEVFEQPVVVSKKSKAEIQRELLTLKRKSLALRREGNVDEAEEVLKTTKGLEAQLAEMEAVNQETSTANNEREKRVITEVFLSENPQMGIKEEALEHENPQMGIKELAFAHEIPRSDENKSSSVQQEILAHKRKALSLKREGKIAEAKEELKQAKLLEKETTNVHNKILDLDAGDQTPVPSTSKVTKKEEPDDSPTHKLSSRDRFKLQQESLSHKRKALKLRREGRHEEAEAEFELAKNLESQLEAATESTKPVGPVDDVSIEDLLDPQLLSALRDIGIEGGFPQSSPEKTEPVKIKPVVNKSQAELAAKAKPVVSRSETVELEEQIKTEKVKALNLKRAGKQAEALDALRRAKALEKKLNSLA